MALTRNQIVGKDELLRRLGPDYEISDVSNPRFAFMFSSDTYNTLINWLFPESKRNYDLIIPRIYLGRLPRNDGFKMPDNLGLVVSVVDFQEMAGKGLFSNVPGAEYWKSIGVQHILVKMLDMTADITPEKILAACAAINKFVNDPINAGKDVYIHCKAGRSRSAMLLAVYLVLYGWRSTTDFRPTGNIESDIESAIKYIKDIRKQIDVGPHKSAKGCEAVLLHSKLNESTQPEEQVVYKDGYDYLSSFEAKQNICQFTSFKALGEYATAIQAKFKYCHRTDHIRDFFNSILHSEDGSWYKGLVSQDDPENPIRKLLDADKGETEYGHADKARRAELIANFTLELNEHLLAKNLSIEPAQRLRIV